MALVQTDVLAYGIKNWTLWIINLLKGGAWLQNTSVRLLDSLWLVLIVFMCYYHYIKQGGCNQ